MVTASRPGNIWGSRKDSSFFRKGFALESKPVKAILRIFVDTGYELHFNGRFVAAVDEWNNTRDYDARPYLVAGKNVVAVKGLNHGGHRGLVCELLAKLEDGSTVSLLSDTSWAASPEERWGWKEVGFDDSKWARARALNFSQCGDWQWAGHPGDGRYCLIPNLDCSVFFGGAIPKCVESPFFSSRRTPERALRELLDIVGTDYQRSLDAFPAAVLSPVKVSDALPGNGSLERPEGIMGKGKPLKVSAPRRFEGPSLIVDFGGETVGYLRLRTKAEGEVHLRLLYGETLAECQHEPPPRDMLLRRMVTEEVSIGSGLQEWESHSRQGFRFVKVEFEDCLAQVEAIAVKTSLYQTPYSGYFSCSDPLLNKIWETGRRTLHLCMQEDYLDGVKRDRLLWTGDTRLEALINYYAFGDAALFERSWTELAKSQNPDGLIPAERGEGSPSLWDYNAWWLIALEDYRLHVGGLDFLSAMRKPMLKAIGWLLTKVGPDGLIDIPANRADGWFLVLNQAVGKDPLMNFLLLRSLRGVANILAFLGDAKGSAKYAKLAAKTAKALGPLVVVGGGSLNAFEELEARFREGGAAEALRFIRDTWGQETGGDTFFESPEMDAGLRVDAAQDWSRYQVGSHCHGWTAGPTCALLSEVLGIKPLEPGFKVFEVKPQLGGLTFAKGVVPTPAGRIAAAFEGAGGRLLVPKGCRARVGLPLPSGKAEVLVDGKAVKFTSDNGCAWFEIARPGVHFLEVLDKQPNP